jgi:hypothetical protein
MFVIRKETLNFESPKTFYENGRRENKEEYSK